MGTDGGPAWSATRPWFRHGCPQPNLPRRPAPPAPLGSRGQQRQEPHRPLGAHHRVHRGDLILVRAAQGKLAREVEALASHARPGDLPTTPGSAEPRTRLLRFEVSPETFATFREALVALRRPSATRLDDDALLLAMARASLGGPRDDGRASYQIGLTVCTQCRRGTQRGGGDAVPVPDDVVTMAECDAQHIGTLAPSARDDNPLSESPSPADLQNTDPQLPRVGNTAGPGPDLSTPDEHRRPRPRSPARQSISPALRRQVLHRDGHRCCVPGCRNQTFLDVHHLLPRSEGGANSAKSLIVLCGAHHRAVHRGDLILHGTATDLTISHADGTPYGVPADPTARCAPRSRWSTEREAHAAPPVVVPERCHAGRVPRTSASPRHVDPRAMQHSPRRTAVGANDSLLRVPRERVETPA